MKIPELVLGQGQRQWEPNKKKPYLRKRENGHRAPGGHGLLQAGAASSSGGRDAPRCPLVARWPTLSSSHSG